MGIASGPGSGRLANGGPGRPRGRPASHGGPRL